MIVELIASITTARYEFPILSFRDVFSGNDDEIEFDVREVQVGDTQLVAVDGLLMVNDFDLVRARLVRNCQG